ncbi:MAG: aminotransferase class I and II [Chloroflexia bacterium]|nr:aminotransferase class I and II [Chloroflexia bacterium]
MSSIEHAQSGFRLRAVGATRYVMPFREGGSLPGLMEADDDGLYVVKFHGAAQGPKTLVAELIAGGIGRLLGLNVPDLVIVDLLPELTTGEPDPEIRDLLVRSVGLNLGLDFLPGALPFDLALRSPLDALLDPLMAADIVWFDALIANVDRTTRNPNLLRWHGELWPIDHGAAIYPHHRWNDPAGQGRRSFPAIADHVLLSKAGSLVEADRRLAGRLTDTDLWEVIGSIPDAWLEPDDEVGDADAQRQAYMTYFLKRLEGPRPFIEEAERARTDVGVGAIDPERAIRGRRRE